MAPLLVSFGAGFLLLCLELILCPVLTPVCRVILKPLSPSCFAVVLAGIGLGGVASGTMQRRGGGVELLASGDSGRGVHRDTPLLFVLPDIVPARRRILSGFLVGIALLSVLLMFPTAFLSGISVPFYGWQAFKPSCRTE